MAKANQSLSVNEPEKGSTDKKQNAVWRSRATFWLGSCLFLAVVLVGPASANYSVDWTPIAEMLDGVVLIMPSMGNLVIAAVPIILIVAVVGFVTGMFDGILDGIQGAFSRMGRR